MNHPPLDLRDIAIIDAFPVYKCPPIVLNIGCGEGRIDFHLMEMGYKVYATDYKKYDTWKNEEKEKGSVKFFKADIFHIESFPIQNSPIVICSEVLEHLVEYKKALRNLIELTSIRLIITIPFEKSFGGFKEPPPIGHCNFWSDKKKIAKYKDVKEFHYLCRPYSTSISKIRTKLRDVEMEQMCYLMVIDKRQSLIF